jgi:chromosome segregation ATPase
MRLTDKDIQKIKYYIEHDSGLNKQDLTNMLDTIEALQQELDSLKKTEQNNTWFCKKLDNANTQMEHRDKVIGELKYEVQCHMDEVTEKCKEVESLQESLIDVNIENERLTYTLAGVMHSVDKWFDKVDENTDEVNRAAQAREIALQAIEKRDDVLKQAEEALEVGQFWARRHEYYASLEQINEAIKKIAEVMGE